MFMDRVSLHEDVCLEDKVDDLSWIEEGLSLLPKTYRDILCFVHILEMEYREAAEKTGVSKSQAWVLGQKGRKLMQFILKFDPNSFKESGEDDFLTYLAKSNRFDAKELVLLSSIYGFDYRSINHVAGQAGIERHTALAWAEGRFSVTVLPEGRHPRYFTNEYQKAIDALKQYKGKVRNTLDYLARITGEPYPTLKRWALRGSFETEDLGEGHIPRYIVTDEDAIAKIEKERAILNNSLEQVRIRTRKDYRTLLRLAEKGMFAVYDRGEEFSKGPTPRYYVDNVEEVVKVVMGK